MNESLLDDREALRCELLEEFGPVPERVPLALRVVSKRNFAEYEECKIEYNVESATSMPAETGRTVSAYLLTPTREQDELLPAVICFHQCAIDCAVGKYAVIGNIRSSVGRVPVSPVGLASIDRRDQAYGLELVHQGFVVLAPDAINCGERNIKAIRQDGQNRKCWGIIDEQLGREAWAKRVFDGMRAVDLLQSLGSVDSEKIGAVGHSMGAEDVYYLMALDERVKAGIRSGEGFRPDDIASKFLSLHSPRLSIGLRGTLDGGSEYLESVRGMYDNARRFYEFDGVPENLMLVELECGHSFTDEYKQQAYELLRNYFGVDPDGSN